MPETLPPVSPRLRRPLWAIWGLLALVALLGQIGSVSRAVAYGSEVDRAFASLGLTWYEYSDGIVVSGATPQTRAAGIGEELWLYGVGDTEITDQSLPDEVARLLAGRDGEPLQLEVEVFEDDSSKVVTLTRSAANRAAVEPQIIGDGIQLLLDALTAFTCLFAAFMLLKRRPADPVAAILAVALAGLGTWGAGVENYWVSAGLDGYTMVAVSIGLGLLVAVFPAFPDGRYQPRWTRWWLIAAPAAALWMHLEEEAGLGLLLFSILTAVAIWAVGRRYRRLPAGDEKQQMKWGAFGFLGSLPMLIASAIVWIVFQALHDAGTPAGGWLRIVGVTFAYSALIMIPIGVMLSLLRYRLNDADVTIGRSAGYATLTLLIGAVWAITTSWANGFIADNLGVSGSAVAPGLSALVAAAVFGPANKKIMSWIEKKFQGALVRLRGLPGRLAKWQQGDDPQEVAAGALGAIVQGVSAQRAALLGPSGELLASVNSHEAAVLAEREDDHPNAGTDEAVFHLRLPLIEAGERVGTLLLGPRSDGASYSRDERAALATVLEPLADAIRVTARRAERNAAFAGVLAAMEARLARIEGPSVAAAE